MGLGAWICLQGLESTPQWLFSLLQPAAFGALLVVAVKTCATYIALYAFNSAFKALLWVAALAWMRENSLFKLRRNDQVCIDCVYCSFLVGLLMPFQAETLSLKTAEGVLSLALFAQISLLAVPSTQSLILSTISQFPENLLETKPLQGPKPASYL